MPNYIGNVQGIKNGDGDSLFHTITKFRPLPEVRVIESVTTALVKRGFSTVEKDRSGKLAVEYLDNKYPGTIFDIFNGSLSDINRLKNDGNVKFKAGNLKQAMELYTKAIHILRINSRQDAHNKLTNHEIAVLFGNRAEVHLQLKDYSNALKDAMESVSYDGHWHKAHVRVGRAQRGQGQNEMAVKAFVNGYCGLKDADDKTKVEVLLELATLCMQVPRDKLNIHQRLPDFPRGQGAIWAQTAYELVRRNQWDPAAVAYFQYLCGEPSPRPVTLNLKPFCNLGMLNGYPWGLDLMLFFLDSGADRANISIDPGDRYLHAIVRMTLSAGRNNNLLEFVIDKFTKPHSEENILDIYGNTALHAATKEKGVAKSKRSEVVVILLNCDVDRTIRNQSGHQAIDILPSNETQNHELLRKTMYKTGSFSAFITRPARNVQSQNKHGNHHPPQPTETKVPEVKKQPAAGSECNKCDALYSMATMLLKEGNTLMAYKNLTDIFQLGHKTPRHEKIAQKCVTVIAKKLAETATPEIPSYLTEIKTEYYSCIVETLANGNKWCQLHAVVLKYRMINGPDKLNGFAKCLSVVPVVGDEQLRGKEELKLQIVKNLLSSGATMGTDNGSSALWTAINLDHYKLVMELIKQGADTCNMSVSAGDTPIHAGVRIALEEKSLGILKILLQQYEANPEKYSHLNPEQFDASGDCLFHLVAKVKYSPIALNVVELLCKKNISSHYYNNEGKHPVDYISEKNDRRLQYLRLASWVRPSVPQEAKGDNSVSEDFQRYSRSDETDARDQKEVIKLVSEKERRKRKIRAIIRLLPDSEASIFSADHSTAKKATMKEVDSGEANVDRQHRMEGRVLKIDSTAADVSNSGDDISSHPADRHAPELDSQQLAADKENYKPTLGSTSGEPVGAPVGVDREQPAEGELGATAGEVDDEAVAGEPELAGSDADSDDSDDEEGEEEQFNIDAQVFDNLEWEVECTADVWKALRDRHMLPELKRRIVRKIQLLASGEWQPVLCKRLRNVRPAHNLNLFEAKFTRGSRILWELAVAFSPRCSETAEKRLQTQDSSNPVRGGRIYSEIIRVWDIVLDHNKIYRSVERIKKSHQRGETCIIQKKLHGIKAEDRLLPVRAAKRFPKLYAEVDVTTGILEEQQQYFPPASANDTEYHILKFYSFSSALVSHVLQNIDTKVDFPFRVTDLEHAIINLRSKAPILLLGRSGTGKTTCCLYRLWSKFHGYWRKAKEADCPLLPRCVEFIHEEATEIDSEEVELPSNENSEDEEDGVCEADQSEVPEDSEMSGQQYDHLHQIFITKNAVLCSEVMKNFRDLSHADELVQDRVALEEESLPCRLGDVDEHAFPLFLTSRQLLLMLDASTGPPNFFDRKDDGSLKVDVVGWTDVDGPLDVLSLLDEDSDMEDDAQYGDHNADDDNEDIHRVATKKVKVDTRREVTYNVFVEEIWPRIKKNERVSYHPSLVWVEIMSFIKGSFEALSKPLGYLDKDEYIKLGKKRAPNFSGERDKIYKFFTRYHHFKAQNQMFDETDLIYDVFRRLQSLKEKPWVIHQIFVDETQDFTQAELCLLIRLCQNPNDMFLTA